ncbi:MAG TPA: hypothetical protein VIB48_01295 [Acidimicrobiia bacterium]|jgi:hypothetical protein
MWFAAVILALVVIAAIAVLMGTRRRATRAGSTRPTPVPPPIRSGGEPTHPETWAGAIGDDDARRHAEAVGMQGVDDADSREIVERLHEEQPSRRLPARAADEGAGGRGGA